MIRLALISCAALASVAGQSLAAEDKPSMEKPKIADREYVKLVTNKGDIYLELNQEKAPVTVKNFLDYVDSGFYNGTIFHRVMGNFMIQGGGFDKDKKQRPTKSPIKNEWRNGLKNKRGTIAMARTASPDSATAQFFINVVDNNSLDQPISGGAGYAVFGKVLRGLDVVDKIKVVAKKQEPGFDDLPIEPIVIEKAMKVNADELKNEIAALRKQEAEEQTQMAQANAAPMEAGKNFVKARGIDIAKGKQSPTGLWFVDVKEGDGGSPTPQDTVTAHYTGWLTNGTKFDSSVDRGQPLVYPLNQLIAGWVEGMGSMKTGGKRWLVVPPEIGYGARGSGQIPPNSVLVFEIELLGVKGK